MEILPRSLSRPSHAATPPPPSPSLAAIRHQSPRRAGSGHLAPHSMTTLPFTPPFCAFAFVGLKTGHGNPRQALRTAEAGNDLAYSRLEEGSYVPVPLPQPRIQGRSHATRRFCKIFIRCLSTVFGIGMVAWLFVGRYLYRDPELQNPLHMIVLANVALGGMAFGFLISQDEDPDM